MVAGLFLKGNGSFHSRRIGSPHSHHYAAAVSLCLDGKTAADEDSQDDYLYENLLVLL